MLSSLDLRRVVGRVEFYPCHECDRMKRSARTLASSSTCTATTAPWPIRGEDVKRYVPPCSSAAPREVDAKDAEGAAGNRERWRRLAEQRPPEHDGDDRDQVRQRRQTTGSHSTQCEGVGG